MLSLRYRRTVVIVGRYRSSKELEGKKAEPLNNRLCEQKPFSVTRAEK